MIRDRRGNPSKEGKGLYIVKRPNEPRGVGFIKAPTYKGAVKKMEKAMKEAGETDWYLHNPLGIE